MTRVQYFCFTICSLIVVIPWVRFRSLYWSLREPAPFQNNWLKLLLGHVVLHMRNTPAFS